MILSKINDETDTTQAASAGIVNTSLLTAIDASWIVDSGEYSYMASDLGLLYNYDAVLRTEKNNVHVHTGNMVSVTHQVNSSILDNHPISNVLVLHDFKIYVLSIFKLTKKLHRSVAVFP